MWVICRGFDVPKKTWKSNVKYNRLHEKPAIVLPAGSDSELVVQQCVGYSRESLDIKWRGYGKKLLVHYTSS